MVGVLYVSMKQASNARQYCICSYKNKSERILMGMNGHSSRRTDMRDQVAGILTAFERGRK